MSCKHSLMKKKLNFNHKVQDYTKVVKKCMVLDIDMSHFHNNSQHSDNI